MAVAYAKAPEVKWPGALDQVTTVIKALMANGYQSRSLGLLGDSSGGALAAAAALKLQDTGAAVPGAIVLLSPWADISEAGDTYQTLKNADVRFTYSRVLKPSADAYVDAVNQKSPYVSPVYGKYSQDHPQPLSRAAPKRYF